MGSQRAPANSQQPAQGKQQSISSFFSAKPAAPKPKPKPIQHGPSSAVESDSPRASHVVDDSNSLFISDKENDTSGGSEKSKRGFGDVEEDNDLPNAKRLRKATQHSIEEAAEAQEVAAPVFRKPTPSDAASNGVEGTRKPKATGRTSKYLFSSSAAEASTQDVDNENLEGDDEETRKW